MTTTLLALTSLGHETASASGNNDALQVVVVGFLFVLSVLAVLAGVTMLLGSAMTRISQRGAAQAPATPGSSSRSAPAQQPLPSAASKDGRDLDNDPVLVVIIAAAVYSVIGDRAHRIVTIRSSGAGWAQEGRRQIFASHKVR